MHCFVILNHMESLKQKAYLALGIAFIIWSFYQFLQQPAPSKYLPLVDESPRVETVQQNSVVYVGKKAIAVEVADTNAERSLGLSNRESLAKGSGLLFIFEKAGNYGFWMKEMLFSIDIVWMDENWQVINVEKSISPQTYPKIFYPNTPAKFVLELNSGDASRLGIDAGQRLSPSH